MSEEKKQIHPLQRAWAAGILEGRVTWPKNGYILRFESVNEEMMKRFHEVVQTGTLFTRGHKQCSRDVYVYQSASMDDTRELLLLIAPFLTSGLHSRAASMIAKIERNKNWQRKHPEKVSSSVTTSPAPTADQGTT